MSDDRERRPSRDGWHPLDKNTGEHIEDPEEIARLTANSIDDSGAAIMFFAVGDYFFERPGRSRVKAMLNMIEFLTPEQQQEFARLLPERLNAEARALLNGAARHEANGSP